jgi:D-beta-D-heptose 7-phosphate kinase/D-beta-D-heptose 1-phosphate adenosyltransferase
MSVLRNEDSTALTVETEKLIAQFMGLRVLVLGDPMLDSYLRGSASRLCQEAPVPIAENCRRENFPGGAANAAANIRALGGLPILLAAVGQDHEAALLKECLGERQVSTNWLLEVPGRQTLAKHRVVAGTQVIVRYDQGTTSPLREAAETALLERLNMEFSLCDAVLISDYGYGGITPLIIERLAASQRKTERIIAVDSKDLSRYRHAGITVAKPNYRQAAMLLQLPTDGPTERAALVSTQKERLLQLTGALFIAVTLDRDGALVLTHDKPDHRVAARPVSESTTSGAGDTFLAALTLALAAGGDPNAATELAAAAADIVVRQEGTAVCGRDELRSYFHPRQSATDLAAVSRVLEPDRRAGRRIVLTCGCFDIVHRGHITYLSQARRLGDLLVVGVNTDESIRRLKGPHRPINSLEDRLEVLRGLADVDHVVPFGEQTPHRLIEAVRPDIFVKGGDYTREKLPEATLVEELGGKIVILPFMDGRSTTGLIERIRRNDGFASTFVPKTNGDRTYDGTRMAPRQKRALR